MPHRNTGGRPPKYNEPSRPVTVTLPESTLRQLELVSPDRGQAIVKLTRHLTERKETAETVRIVDVGQKSGLILVGPSPTLEKIPFLHLVEVAPARYLLAVENGHDFGSLELAIQDLVDANAIESDSEKHLIQDLLTTIRRLRRTQQASHAEILLVNLAAQ